MAPIKLGVVGFSLDGWFKDAHLPALQNLTENYTLTAAATSRQESADQVAKQYHITAFGGPHSAEQLAQDADVDMVVVAVKTPLHKQSALHAIHAHKSVFLEWPLGNGLQQAIELAQAAKENGIRTMIGLQARQDLAILKAKQLLDQHAIGKVLSSTFIGYGGAWGPAVQQRNAYTLDEKNGTTLLTVPFGHFIDAFVYLLGDFESLSAYKTTVISTSTVIETGERVDVKTAPDQLVVQGQLLSGALAAVHYRGGNPLPGSQGLVWEIEGEKGLITFKASGTGHIQASSIAIKPAPDQDDFLTSPILPTAPRQLISPELYLNGEQVDLPQDKLGNIGRLYAAFAKGDQSGDNDWDHAVRNHRIVDAVERSCKEGRRTSYL